MKTSIFIKVALPEMGGIEGFEVLAVHGPNYDPLTCATVFAAAKHEVPLRLKDQHGDEFWTIFARDRIVSAAETI